MTRRSLFTLYCCVLAVLLALPAVASDVPDGFSEVVVFATNSAMVKTNMSEIQSGHLIVNDEAPDETLEKDFELGFGKDASIAGMFEVGIQGNTITSKVVAHRLRVRTGATIHGDAFYNFVQVDNGGTNGVPNTPVTLPFYTTLPPFRSGAPGTTDVTVLEGTSDTLPEGDYGDVVVEDNATLVFSGGVYNLRSLTAGNLTNLQFSAPAEVRIDEKFKSGNDATVNSPSSSVPASRVVFFVNGINGTSGGINHHPAAAEMGSDSAVEANFYAPNGRILLKDYTVATGAFVARDVQITKGVIVNLNSFFNEPPEPADDTASGLEGGPVVLDGGAGSVLENDDDPNADDTLTVTTTPVSGPSHASAFTLNSDGSFSYTHNGSENHADAFVYEVCDDGNPVECATATVTIAITPVNDPPVIDQVAAQNVLEDAAEQTVNLSGIAQGGDPPDHDNETLPAPQFPMTITAVSDNPGLIPNPTVTYDGTSTTGSLAYTPVADQYGSAEITVTVQDSAGTANGGDDDTQMSFTIDVTPVNDPPTIDPIPDAGLPVNAGLQTVNLTGISQGGSGETLPGQTPLTVTATSSDTSIIPDATVTYTSPQSTGSLSYTPVANEEGVSVITVTVMDAGGTANGGSDNVQEAFTVVVGVPNPPPTAGSQQIPDPFPPANTDAPLVITLTGSDPGPLPDNGLDFALVSGPLNGNLTAGDLPQDDVLGGSVVVHYNPNNPGGADSFVFSVCDNDVPEECAFGIITINTTDPLNNPPVAVDQAVETDGDVDLALVLMGTDPDLDPVPPATPDTLTFSIVTHPTAGVLSGLTDDPPASATVTYNPNGDGDVEDSFTFEVCDDGTPVRCDATGLVSINAPAETPNDPPTPQADAIRVEPGQTATTLFPDGDSVLDNDSDPNPLDVLTVTTTPVSGPDHASAFSLSTDGTFSYTHDGLGSTSDQFVYEVCDDGTPSLCATATVFIEVEQATMHVAVTISASGSAGGSVISDPAGIDCGPDCVEDFDTANDLPIDLLVVPDAGSVFAGWTGSSDCADGTLQVAADASCTALFAEPPPPGPDATVTMELAGDGGGFVTSSPAGIDCGTDCSETVVFGTRLQLRAFPDSESRFLGFSPKDPENPETVDTDCNDGELDGTVNADCIATFEALPETQFTLTIDFLDTGTGSGDVTSDGAEIACSDDCSALFDPGATVVLNARPAEGSTFAGYTGAGCGVVLGFEATITMGADTTCTATFNSE